jgi:cytidine deaminase
MATKKELINRARQAAGNAYAPYSKFFVGAAVEFYNQVPLYSGCNVENASYGLTICAERNAICSGIIDGGKRVKKVAISVKNAGIVGGAMPCGACLQFMAEFGDDNTIIYVDGLGAWKLKKLLPHRF